MDETSQLLDGSPIDRAVFSTLLAVGVLVLVTRRKRMSQLLWANKIVLLFFLYAALSFAWSDYPGVAFKRWSKALGDLVMIFIVLSDREPIQALRKVLSRLTFLIIPLSVLFIKYVPSIGVGYSPWGGKPNYAGITTHKSNLGSLCLIFGLASLYNLQEAYGDKEDTRRMQRMLAHGLILGMALWLLRTIDTKTSISCFAMASALLIAASFRFVRRRPMAVNVLMASMVTISAAVLFLGASPDLLTTMGRDPTLTDRTDLWSKLLDMVHNPVLGAGFESFWLGPRLDDLWATYWWHPNQAHNGYLEIYLNLGCVGIALLSIVLMSAHRTVMSRWRSDGPIAGLLLAYFFVGLVYNFTEAAFFRMQSAMWIFILFAIIDVPLPFRRPVQVTPRRVPVYYPLHYGTGSQ